MQFQILIIFLDAYTCNVRRQDISDKKILQYSKIVGTLCRNVMDILKDNFLFLYSDKFKREEYPLFLEGKSNDKISDNSPSCIEKLYFCFVGLAFSILHQYSFDRFHCCPSQAFLAGLLQSIRKGHSPTFHHIKNI